MAVAVVGAAVVSLAVAMPAPSYDPWAWLLWGREIAGGTLSTADGPSFKPLPVAVDVPLSLAGDAAAPWLWVLIARAGALLALVLAFRLGRRLAADPWPPPRDRDARFAAVIRPQIARENPALAEPREARLPAAMRPQVAPRHSLASGPVVAGLLAGVAVALCEGYAAYAGQGMVVGWVLALGLGCCEAWRAGRPRLALACAVGACLLQVEAWPFALAFGAYAWRRSVPSPPSTASRAHRASVARAAARSRASGGAGPGDRGLRAWLVAAAVAVPLLWLVPELLGSSDLLRSAERAQVPNPGQPAEAAVPALESLDRALALLPWPLWLGLAALAALAVRYRQAVGAARAPHARRAGSIIATRVPGAARRSGVAAAVRAPGGPEAVPVGGAGAAPRAVRDPADTDLPHGGERAALLAALVPAAIGAAWVLLVAAMSQLGGFSGEPRYALPGVAAIAISGAVGLVVGWRALADAIGQRAQSRAGASGLTGAGGAAGTSAGDAAGTRAGGGAGTSADDVAGSPAGGPVAAGSRLWTPARSLTATAVAAVVVAVLALGFAPRLADLRDVRAAQAHQWRLQRQLPLAVAIAGGRAAVLECGRPYVGPLRGPLAAYWLGVEKQVVEPDLPPRAPGVVFRSRLGRDGPLEPHAPPGFANVGGASEWQVLRSCRPRR